MYLNVNLRISWGTSQSTGMRCFLCTGWCRQCPEIPSFCMAWYNCQSPECLGSDECSVFSAVRWCWFRTASHIRHIIELLLAYYTYFIHIFITYYLETYYTCMYTWYYMILYLYVCIILYLHILSFDWRSAVQEGTDVGLRIMQSEFSIMQQRWEGWWCSCWFLSCFRWAVTWMGGW